MCENININNKLAIIITSVYLHYITATQHSNNRNIVVIYPEKIIICSKHQKHVRYTMKKMKEWKGHTSSSTF